MINFDCKFVSNSAQKQFPLHYVKGNKKHDKIVIQWNDISISAFEEYKKALAEGERERGCLISIAS